VRTRQAGEFDRRVGKFGGSRGLEATEESKRNEGLEARAFECNCHRGDNRDGEKREAKWFNVFMK
jgi:hypothetical protein